MNNRKNLQKKIEKQVNRIKKAEQEQSNPLIQSFSISTIILVMLIPIIGGAYLGHWLDEMAAGYSVRWTLSFIFIGIVVGFLNVYFLIKEN